VIGSYGADTDHRRLAGCVDQCGGCSPPRDLDFCFHWFIGGLNGGHNMTDGALGGGEFAGCVVGVQIPAVERVN
jgi:hypothetical protein